MTKLTKKQYCECAWCKEKYERIMKVKRELELRDHLAKNEYRLGGK